VRSVAVLTAMVLCSGCGARSPLGPDPEVPLEASEDAATIDARPPDGAAHGDAALVGDAAAPEAGPEGGDAGCPPASACPPGGCQPVALASGLSSAHGIAVDSTSAYLAVGWGAGANGQIVKVPLAGGSLSVLASGLESPARLAVNASDVYWAGYGSNAIMAVPLAGGAMATVVANEWHPWSVAVDSTNLYWTDPLGSPAVKTVPLAGGTPVTLWKVTTGGGPWDLVVDHGDVFWAAVSDVMTTSLLGGAAVSLASGQHSVHSLVLDSTNVYWADSAPSPMGALRTVPRGGGPVTALATGQNNPLGVAVDGAHVYWTTLSDGKIMRVPIGGGSPEVLATGQLQPDAIAVDCASIYWVNGGTNGNHGDGSVMRLTKPAP
jgi:hypothetical protein